MRILLTPLGSHGDVLPFIAIGQRLKEQGHEVILITNEHYRHYADRHGFAFEQVGTDEEYETIMHDPNLWHPRKSIQVVLGEELLKKSCRATYEHVARLYIPGETVVVSGVLSFGARIAQEKLGVPLVTVFLQPMIILSSVKKVVALGIPRWLPAWMTKKLFHLIDWAIIDRVIGKGIQPLRTELGLPRVRRVLSEWVHSPLALLGTFPDWFGSAPDWPKHLTVTGFVRYDADETSSVSAALANFLAEGSPHVIFTFGSAMRQARPYFETAIRTCQSLNQRGLLLGKAGTQIPSPLPSNIFQADYIPFSQVFPKASVVVHHGGIGTTAQALAAGVPQLVMPMAFDQYDNADRLEKLGVAQVVPANKFHPKQVIAALERLLHDPSIRQKCEVYRNKMTESDAIHSCCEVITRLKR